MIKTISKWMMLCVLFYISSACSHQQSAAEKLSIQSIYGSNNCLITEPTIKSIASQDELNQLLRSMQNKFSLTEMFEPEIDYDNQMLILYALGQKPSSGYSIKLTKSDATLKKQMLHLPVRVNSPASDSMQAQVITSPCTILLLPRVEYSEIVIDDKLTD